MFKPSHLEQRRIKHINYIMGELHDSVDELYKLFMDKKYTKCKQHTGKLIARLKDIIESLEDEI